MDKAPTSGPGHARRPARDNGACVEHDRGPAVGWRDRPMAGAPSALKERERNDRDNEITRLKVKVGEITIGKELR